MTKPRLSEIHLMLTMEEKRLIEQAAKLIGLPTATWARPVLLAEARRVLSK